MKQKIILSIFTIVIVALTFSCAKDSFKETIGICPAVAATSPLNEETNVDLNKVITVTFNEEMNPATLTQSSFTIVNGTISI